MSRWSGAGEGLGTWPGSGGLGSQPWTATRVPWILGSARRLWVSPGVTGGGGQQRPPGLWCGAGRGMWSGPLCWASDRDKPT